MKDDVPNKENIIRVKSFDFAVRIVNLYKILYNDRKEWILSKQLLRAGTSIGANIEEAMAAISKKDFIAKCHISYKEAFETLYWLKLLYKTEYITEKEYQSISEDSDEIIRILTKILKSSKENS